jgi:hypothetical protein
MSIHGSSFGQGSINSWMLSHSSDINKQVDRSVSAGYTSVEEQEALKDIQNCLASTGTRGGYGTVQHKIDDFLKKYGQNEEIARLAPALQAIARWGAVGEACYQTADVDQINAEAARYAGDVQVMCDRLGNDQKYGDIERQDLSSQRDQAFQMATNLTNTQNQTLSTILTTLRG